MSRKFAYILEIIWLVVTLITFAATLHSIITCGFIKSAGFVVVFLISLFMYYLRRNSRKNK